MHINIWNEFYNIKIHTQSNILGFVEIKIKINQMKIGKGCLFGDCNIK